MLWGPLLLSPASRGGTSSGGCQGGTLGAVGIPRRVAASSPHLMRFGSVGCAVEYDLHSQQIVVLSFPTVLRMHQRVALES